MAKQNNIIEIKRNYGTESTKNIIINLALKRIENAENLRYNTNVANPAWEVGESA